MKREETLLSAMGGMEEDFLMEAENYRKTRRRTLRKGMIAIAAVVALMVTSATVLATNDTWRNTIRGWLGIGESSASGYAEYDDQTVRMGGDDTAGKHPMQRRSIGDIFGGNTSRRRNNFLGFDL